MRFAPHYIEACEKPQPPAPSSEPSRRSPSSIELALVAELAARGMLDVAGLRTLLADRDAHPSQSLVSVANVPDLRNVLARPARYVQIEAEALFAALLVREGIASLPWVLRFLETADDRETWIGVGLIREGVLGEADLPWLFENRRLLHGRAQARQAQGFLDALAGARDDDALTAHVEPWLLCPRDPTASAVELLRRTIPNALSLLAGASLEAYKPARPSEPELAFDALVHGYRILSAISQGSRGVVYRARHLFTHREVALKIIPLRHPNNFGRAAEFWREAVAMSRVTDRRVVNTYDFGGCKEYYYYASDLISGQLLKDVDRRTISTSTIVDCSRDIALALKAIRDAGVVHRDVIPSNILLGDDGVTRLLDYGDVWFESDVRVPGRSPPGTIPYIAPEEIAATAAPDPEVAPRVDERSDEYMLGVVLFELLTGAPPFAGSQHEFMAWVHDAAIPNVRSVAPQIAPELDSVVARMTRRRPADRFQSLEELIAALDGITSSERAARRATP